MADTRGDTGRERLQFMIIQSAFVFSCIVYAAVGYYVDRSGSLQGGAVEISWLPYLKNALLILSVALFPILRVLQRSFHRSLESRSPDPGIPRPARAAEALLPRYVILFTLAEIPAIFGLLLFFLGSPLKTLFLLVGISLFCLAFMTPPRELFPQPRRSL